ncbi:kinase-like domain-containing protein [Aspergillus avenaceus]|uniref:Kinase-like domain-containing protein n=1 Tax=Aspergillus avenaceus TaxID=36643 RepID=A0A5N6THJ3_ASPAV|nr:kinase-like domain-containing protein [Aspergillus avenaceus]
MTLSKTYTWLRDTVWYPATQEPDESKSIGELPPNNSQAQSLHTTEPESFLTPQQPSRMDREDHNVQSQLDEIEPANTPVERTHPSPFSQDPYVGLPLIGNGLNGFVYYMGEGRVVKKAKQYELSHLRDPEDLEYMNEINQQTLENEVKVFERLGCYEGIIPCFRTSQYGIELALAQGDLESYIETSPERENALKIRWISSLIETLAYVHSHKVFVNDIALRNILVLDEQLKLADFGQSMLLPLDIDITSANENDLNVQIEILHLGWILYSVASWHVHKYCFFGPENPDLCWPALDSFPNVDGVLCGKIIEKCWRGEYASMVGLKNDARQFLIN